MIAKLNIPAPKTPAPDLAERLKAELESRTRIDDAGLHTETASTRGPFTVTLNLPDEEFIDTRGEIYPWEYDDCTADWCLLELKRNTDGTLTATVEARMAVARTVGPPPTSTTSSRTRR